MTALWILLKDDCSLKFSSKDCSLKSFLCRIALWSCATLTSAAAPRYRVWFSRQPEKSIRMWESPRWEIRQISCKDKDNDNDSQKKSIRMCESLRWISSSMKRFSFTMVSRRILLVSSRACHTDNCQCSSVGKRFFLAFSWQPFSPILSPGAGRVHGDCSILGRGVSFSIRRKKMSQKRHKQRFRGKPFLHLD